MSVKQEWGVRIKVLIITALIASLGNVLATWKDVRDGVEGASIVMPWETLSVMVVMLIIVVVGCEVDDLLRKINIKLPKVLYIFSDHIAAQHSEFLACRRLDRDQLC